MDKTTTRSLCHECKHYYITWDQLRPYGCRKWQFKSKLLPAIEVKKSSGKDCLLFENKTK